MRPVLLFVSLLMLAIPSVAQDAPAADPFDDIVVSDDISALPEAVAKKREALIEATETGDIESLRAIIDDQDVAPNVSFGQPDDAVAHLKGQSADPEGRQMLALLRNLLEMPYAVLGAGGDTPNYVWPYLAVADITALEPSELVDAYRLVTPEQLAEMNEFGGWFWWRVYIGADGEWQAFVAGD